MNFDRPKGGSDYGDRDENGPSEQSAPRKMEPAPPPKENAWTRRSQQSQGPRSNDIPVSKIILFIPLPPYLKLVF